MSTEPASPRAAKQRLKVRLLTAGDRDAALVHLCANPLHNLQLVELASRLGGAWGAAEVPPQLAGAWRGRRLVGVLSLRPSLVLGAAVDEEMLDAWLPFLEAVPSGLVKSDFDGVSALWRRLQTRGRGPIVDRTETAYVLRRTRFEVAAPPPPPEAGLRWRPALDGDLDELVDAARASLREEGRPDPFDGDPSGFRRWVRGRLCRARVVEAEGRIGFVGYADVRRPEGWLIQGVYTFPDLRRRGLAAVGMAGITREAFASGADHVQLAVVRGNRAAIRLYEGLGFEPFAKLRTVLFV